MFLLRIFVPEIRLASQPKLEIEKESTCILTITNPTDSIVKVRVEPLDIENASEEELDSLGDIVDELNATVSLSRKVKCCHKHSIFYV